MGVYVPDPFQQMPLGSAVPQGWSAVGNSKGNVRAFSDLGAFFPHKWYDMNMAELRSPLFTNLSGHAVSLLTVWLAWQPEHGTTQATIASLRGPSNVGTQQDVAVLKQEPDATLSVYVNGSPATLVSNTGLVNRAYWGQGISAPNWYYIQWNVFLTITPIGGLNYLQVVTSLAVDGEKVIDNVSGNSNSILDTSFSGSIVGSNQIVCENEMGLGELYVVDRVAIQSYPAGIWTVALLTGGSNYSIPNTTVSITDSTGSGALITPVIDPSTGIVTDLLLANGGLNYSNPSLTIVDSSGHGSGATASAALAPTPFRRIAQGVVENIFKPSVSNALVNQAVIELPIKINTSNVRISQAVIELLIQRQVVPGGWNVTES